MSTPNTSNFNATAGALSFTVNTHATLVKDALDCLAAYINSIAGGTPGAGATDAASQKLNELVAVLNEVAA